MYIKIEEVDTLEKEVILRIKRALKEKWFHDGLDTIDDITSNGEKSTIEGSYDGYLCGGESEEEFSLRITKTVWDIAGKFIPVHIAATYLEELPHETYEFDKNDYDLYQEKGAKHDSSI